MLCMSREGLCLLWTCRLEMGSRATMGTVCRLLEATVLCRVRNATAAKNRDTKVAHGDCGGGGKGYFPKCESLYQFFQVRGHRLEWGNIQTGPPLFGIGHASGAYKYNK